MVEIRSTMMATKMLKVPKLMTTTLRTMVNTAKGAQLYLRRLLFDSGRQVTRVWPLQPSYLE